MNTPREEAQALIRQHVEELTGRQDLELEEYVIEDLQTAVDAARISARTAMKALEDTVYGDLYNHWRDTLELIEINLI